jgi:ABC-type cobalamin transport system permease subunit
MLLYPVSLWIFIKEGPVSMLDLLEMQAATMTISEKTLRKSMVEDLPVEWL